MVTNPTKKSLIAAWKKHNHGIPPAFKLARLNVKAEKRYGHGLRAGTVGLFYEEPDIAYVWVPDATLAHGGKMYGGIWDNEYDIIER